MKLSTQYKKGNAGEATATYCLAIMQRLRLLTNTPAYKLIAHKKTSVMTPGKLIKWGFMLLFTVTAFSSVGQVTPVLPLTTTTQSVCLNETRPYVVADVATSNFTWSISPGVPGTDWVQTSTGHNSIDVQWKKTGVYTMTVTETVIATGCQSTVSLTVTVSDLPAAPVASNQTVCEASPVQTLTATATAPANATVVWYDAATGGNVVASPTLNAVGTVTYYAQSVSTAAGSCPSLTRTAVVLTIDPKPTPTAGSNTPICEGFTLNLTGSPVGMASYAWSGPAGFNAGAQNASIPNAPVTASGTYTLTVTDSKGCTGSAQTTVLVNPKPITTPITHN